MTEACAPWRIFTFTDNAQAAEAVIARVYAYISNVYQPPACDCWLISNN